MKTIYIAGPMRGIQYFNFIEFFKAEVEWKSAGYNVINPARQDEVIDGFDPYELPKDYDWSKEPDTMNLDEVIDRDIAAVRSADAIYMLKGWEKSLGACAEHAIAKWQNSDIIYEEKK